MENEKKRRGGGGGVRCTAEGIDSGLFVARRDGGVMAEERFKVVALVAAVMCLCNADRVVMSVAVVPLAAKHGWSSSFLGIVQVPFSFSILNYFLFFNMFEKVICFFSGSFFFLGAWGLGF